MKSLKVFRWKSESSIPYVIEAGKQIVISTEVDPAY